MKKLLFFDIECSNCYGGSGKVCEFGAVLTDENFKIIREYDIPMSPGQGRENRFDVKIYQRDSEFDWAYEKDFYFACPEFPCYYQEIKELLENEDIIVFGYSVDNDIRYLSSSIKRYHLSQLSYRAHDIRPMIKSYSKQKLQVGGLKGAFLNFYDKKILIGLVPHLSRDDAKMTMMITKKLCENLDASVDELIELCPDCYYDSLRYLAKYEAGKEDERLHPKLCQKHKSTNRVKYECQAAWGKCYRECLPLLEKEESIGSIVAISSKLKEDMEHITNTIDAIKKNNLVAYDGISGSDYLVVLDENDKERLLSMFKHPYSGQIIMYNDFINMQHSA